MNVEARIAKTEDLAEILEVVRQAFGRADEADLVAALVAAGDARLSLVAVDGEQVVGHVLFSEMAIVGDKHWEAWITKLAAPFYAKEAQYFHTADMAAAWSWVKE